MPLQFERYFTSEKSQPLDEVQYTRTTAKLSDAEGHVYFELKDVEVPASWSQLAVDILVSKYFRKAGVPKTGHEVSVKQVIGRITRALRTEAVRLGYLDRSGAKAFEADLNHLLIHQMGAFNSPVWFNLGLFPEYRIRGSNGNFAWNPKRKKVEATSDAYSRPQCSACFIQGVEDELMSIFELAKNEARLFKYGSGTGTNFSKIRGRQEQLEGGGNSSGLMSFLEVLDRGAGATKSGGITRRAAKMVCLDLDHPEIEDFITWKSREEKKVAALVRAGYSADFDGEAYHTVSGQNSNNSVRVTDEFMRAVERDEAWETRARTTGGVVQTYRARDLWRKIAESAWACADPGLQFDTLIQRWHTCKKTGPIRSSNPCSEFMFLDDSACNLASLNLVKFLKEDGQWDVEAYLRAARTFLIAQEILVTLSSYPTQKIAENSYRFRPLGLGFANLGALLMRLGIPYDSEAGRNWASTLTALLCGHAYSVSAEMASCQGTFQGFKQNRTSMLQVIQMHQKAAKGISSLGVPRSLVKAAQSEWDRALARGKKYGYRNAQVTVMAPTGTIGLLMDCDTTGVEPEFALVKFKKLAGGGLVKIVNQSVSPALRSLGYPEDQISEILESVLATQSVEGAPHLSPEHLAVFDCAQPSGPASQRWIAPLGHLKMLAAIQPWVSGAISKTVNLPHSSTVEEIQDLYFQSWKLGLKAIALYRDGSKLSQPLSTRPQSESESTASAEAPFCESCS